MSNLSADNLVSASGVDSASTPTPPRWNRIKESAVRLAFVVNLAVLAAMIGWIASDGQFMAPSTRLISAENLAASNASPFAADFQVIPMSEGRLQWLWIAGGLAIGTLLVLFVGLFFGVARHRRVRSWLEIMALAVAWLTLSSTWPQLLWAGQRWRMERHIDDFDSIVQALRRDWPTQDGVSDQLGPFSAYPIGKPQMLMPLSGQSIDGLSFSSIERSKAGGLRFELGGNEHGVWLEWHPDGQAPASFKGGLEAGYELVRSTALHRGWFLAKYREFTVSGPEETWVPFNRAELAPTE